MKYFKRLKVYKASNVSFNPLEMRAYSYAWWRFVDRINGKIVFNGYRYSPSTGKHQSKVLSLLRELGIEPQVYIEAPKGLQDLTSAIRYYESNIQREIDAIQRPRSRKDANERRASQIRFYQSQIEIVRQLMKGMN